VSPIVGHDLESPDARIDEHVIKNSSSEQPRSRLGKTARFRTDGGVVLSDRAGRNVSASASADQPASRDAENASSSGSDGILRRMSGTERRPPGTSFLGETGFPPSSDASGDSSPRERRLRRRLRYLPASPRYTPANPAAIPLSASTTVHERASVADPVPRGRAPQIAVILVGQHDRAPG
jgi:hypothetical protein